ncbi:12804_t:CDS:2, partial [Gigaspora margarita]
TNKHNPSNLLRVVQRKEVRLVLEAMHESAIGGHLGEKATTQKIWQRGKPTSREPLHPIKPTQLFDKIGINFIGPLPKIKERLRHSPTPKQEILEQIVLPKRKTSVEKIRENLYMYLQDLNQVCDLNTQRKMKSQILETYFKLEAILAEKGWNDVGKKKFNEYFSL